MITRTIQATGLKSYDMSLAINRGQRAFNKLLKTCLGHHGLTISQWSLLGKLYESTFLRPYEAAELLGAAPALLSKVIKFLQAEGYITCQVLEDDERGKVLALTPSGKSLVEQVEFKLEKCLNDQLGSQKAGDLQVYFGVSEFIARNVRHH